MSQLNRRLWPWALLLLVILSASTSPGSGPEAAAQQEKSREEIQSIWNRVFSETNFGFSREANRFLVEVTRDLSKGSALDIGMGEGRNSLFLAQEGWNVTGIDISDEGVRQAKAQAKEKGLELEAIVVDVGEFDFGEGKWDLVTAMYMHGLIVPHADKIVRSLKPGGLLVIEGFHRDLNRQSVQGGYFGYRSNQLLQIFKSLRVLFYEDRVDTADWGGQQKHPIVRFVATKSPMRQ